MKNIWCVGGWDSRDNLDFKFEILDLRFEISDLRFEISDLRLGIAALCNKLSDSLNPKSSRIAPVLALLRSNNKKGGPEPADTRTTGR